MAKVICSGQGKIRPASGKSIISHKPDMGDPEVRDILGLIRSFYRRIGELVN